MYVGEMLNKSGSDTRGLTLGEAPASMSVRTRIRGYDSAMDGGYMHTACALTVRARLGRHLGGAGAQLPRHTAASSEGGCSLDSGGAPQPRQPIGCCQMRADRPRDAHFVPPAPQALRDEDAHHHSGVSPPPPPPAGTA